MSYSCGAETGVPDLARPLPQLLSIHDLAGRPAPRYVVEGLIVEKSIAFICSTPGVGKTFVAMDMAMAVALGNPWHGLKTRPGAVYYVMAEGASSKRARALAERHKVNQDDVNLYFFDGAIHLNNASEVNDLVQFLSDGDRQPPAVVIVDTLACSIPGVEENSARQMGLVLKNLGRIRDATGAAVLVLHHFAKASGGARGSSAISGGADTILELHRSKDRLKLQVRKQRDDILLPAVFFSLRQWKLADGVTSCVVVPAELAQPAQLGGHGGNGSGELGSPSNDAVANRLKVLRAYQAAEGRRTTREEIGSKLGVGTRTVARARSHLVKAGYLEGNAVTPSGRQWMERLEEADV